MKTFLLSLTLLIAFPAFSQNYRTVSTDSEVYFDFKEVDFIYQSGVYPVTRMIKTDSFQVNNNDTIIYHKFNQEFETRGDTVYNPSFQYIACFSTNDTGFLSYKTILQDDGTDIYFNRFQDSIFIQTQANLNDTWTFYQNNDGYFEATVSSIISDNFLGLTDSIKIITLQAKDVLGNNIASPYDTLNIRISKNYGLIEGFNLFRFPYGVTVGQYSQAVNFKSIDILGSPQHNVGIKNLTARDVFDYAVGDEYHWRTSGGSASSGGFSSYSSSTYEIILINDKEYSANGDTVYYDVYLEKYNYTRIQNNPSDITSSFDTLYHGDTTVVYDISENENIDTYPLHYGEDSVRTWIQSADGNRKRIRYWDGATWNVGGCNITEIRNSGSAVYHKGIGYTYQQGGVNMGSESRKFVYYNKNGTTWGTPLNIQLLSNTSEPIKEDIILKIFPNPATDLLNFQLEAPINNAEVRIYSTLGQLIETQNMNSEQTQFNVADWKNGMYFYGVFVAGERVKSGQVLIKE